MKRAWMTAAMLGVVLAAAPPALATTEAGPGPSDLGLESVTVTSAALDTRTKQAVVSGTVVCSEPLSVFLDSAVRQTVGRFDTVEGRGGGAVECDGATPFSVVVSPDGGRFGGGSAAVFAAALATNDQGAFDFAEVGPVQTKLTPLR